MDYHILEVSNDLKTVNVIFHVPIPTGNNTVEVAWRTALVAHKGGADAITSLLLDIIPADLTAMKAGEILEIPCSVRFGSLVMTDTERLDKIKTEYTIKRASELADLQIKLKYYGRKGDV